MTVTADLATLKRMLGSRTMADDDVLTWALDACVSYVSDRVYPAEYLRDDVQSVVLLAAGRLYKRRLMPEGMGGWDEEGATRLLGRTNRTYLIALDRDPDIAAMLERREDLTQTGFA